MTMSNARRPVTSADLHQALRGNQLTLAYQPKIALDTQRMIGVEALARWLHPQLGPIPPSDFIPLAEEGDLINPLTEWAVATAAADWTEWRGHGLMLNVAVNISARNLDRLDFPDTVAEICRAGGMPCEHLAIELTESATQGAVNLLDTLTRFRIKGMDIALDDFGTGYSSLAQLQQLPFSDLKIDRSFVMRADTSKDCRVIVRTVIDLAHNLGLRAIAEGVETEIASQMLTDFGCDQAQGYVFARPVPARDLCDWAFRQEPIARTQRVS
jgi:EAL domain-containing protein (putative c-di-GMP-specific phosphodiesterase class I)